MENNLFCQTKDFKNFQKNTFFFCFKNSKKKKYLFKFLRRIELILRINLVMLQNLREENRLFWQTKDNKIFLTFFFLIN